MNYNREKAIAYAKEWALKRNPLFYDFSALGGDCTNFASQILFSGAPVMNDTETFGWYYYSINNRAPAWTGVEEFCNFIINNKTRGPFGELTTLSNLSAGDFVQLGKRSGFYHTLAVVGFNGNVPIVCSHSFDKLNAPLTSYYYERLRFIKILGVRE